MKSEPSSARAPVALIPTALLACVLALMASALVPPTVQAQERPALTVDDYGQWERLGGATLSPNGRWVAVGISRVNDEGELRVHSTDSDSVVVVPFATRPVFSSDSRWLAYPIGVSPDERERMQKQKQPVRNKLGLLDLNTGEQETVDDIQSFSFSEDGLYLALRRYKPDEKKSDGVDVVVRELLTGASLSLGNVAQTAWRDERKLSTIVRHFTSQFSDRSFPSPPSPSPASSAGSTAQTGSGGLIQTSAEGSAAWGGPATKRSGRAA